MSTANSGGAGARQGASAYVITALLLVAAALLFVGIYLALPAGQHFDALLWIGALALVFALASYLLGSVSRDPAAQRSVAYGFMGMGFATLFLTVGLGPTYGVESQLGEIEGLIVLLLLVVVAVAGIAWRARSRVQDQAREAEQAAWRDQASAPSAFSYAAANGPNVPAQVQPPSPPGGAPPPRSP
jgi:hypothetical protein